MRSRVLAAAILAAVLSSACAEPERTNPYDPQSPEALQAPATIVGTLRLEGGADPSGALVSVLGTSKTAPVDADGAFVVSELPAGVYTLVFSRDGFQTTRLPGISAGIGERVDVGEVVLPVGRGVVRGTVQLRDARDHGGATVSLVTSLPRPPETGGEGDEERAFAVVTSTSGDWELDVPAGQYFLLVRKDGYQPACAGQITIIKDGELVSVGVIELTSTSALVRFATPEGLDLEPVLVDGRAQTFTSTRALKARFTASGAVGMRAAWSRAELAALDFDAFAVELDTELPEGPDGERTLYVDLRDQCQLTQSYQAAITLDMTPPEGWAQIAEGARFLTAEDGTAPVSLTAVDETSGVASMRLTTDGSDPADAEAQPFVRALVAAFGAEEGEKTLRALFVDRAGNVSEEAQATITKDSTPPQIGAPALTILGAGAGGAVASRQVELLFAVEGEQPAEVAVGNASGTEAGPWRPFLNPMPWALADGADGPRSVFARFRDEAGNATDEVQADVLLDATAPLLGSVALAGGERFANVDAVELQLTVDDPASTSVRLSNCADFCEGSGCDLCCATSGFVPFSATVTGWSLAGCADGPVTVYARFRDAAGNESPAQTSLVLDRQPPQSPEVTIAAGADYLAAPDGVAAVRFSAAESLSGLAALKLTTDGSDPQAAPERPFEPQLLLDLGAADGPKQVRALFVDAAGNVSAEAGDDVIKDSNGPAGLSLGFWSERAQGEAVTLTGERAVVLLAEVQTEFAPLTGVAFGAQVLDCASARYEQPEILSTQTANGTAQVRLARDWNLLGADGEKRAFACFEDAAGNRTGPVETAQPAVLDTAAPSCAFTLAGGAPVVAMREVGFALAAPEAGLEILLEGGVDPASPLSPGVWTAAPASQTPVLLAEGDGPKTLTVRCVDAAGNEGAQAIASISVDATPPSGDVLVAGGARWATAPIVPVTVRALDANGVESMKLLVDAEPDCALPDGWVDFARETTATLPETEGPHTVHACLRDRAGNTALAMPGEVQLDLADPSGTVSIAGGAAWTNSLDVTVRVSPSADTAQLAVLDAAATCASVVDWLEYDGAAAGFVDLAHRLDCVEGTPCAVHVCLRDRAGRTSDPLSDTIGYDATAPIARSVAVQGAAFTRALAVTVDVDAEGATEMRLTGDVADTGWIPYAASAALTLTPGDGAKAIALQVRDAALNEASAQTSVLLDTTAPTAELVLNWGERYATSTPVSARFEGSDPSGFAEMKFGLWWVDCQMPEDWQPYVQESMVDLMDWDSTYPVMACLRDGAGNVSEPFGSEVVLELTDPSAMVTVNGWATHTNSLDVDVQISSSTWPEPPLMKVSNWPMTCAWESGWVAFQSSVRHRLSCASGDSCNVYVCLKSAGGRTSALMSDADGIVYDATPPSFVSFTVDGGASTNALPGSLTMSYAENLADPVEMRVWGDVTAPNADWTAFASPLAFNLTPGDGAKLLRAQLRDLAGNVSEIAVTQVTLDSTAPVAPVVTTPRDFVNATSTSVTVALPVPDPTFSHFEVCTSSAATPANCPFSCPNAYAFQPSSFSLGLTANQAACVWARAVDVAGNVGGSGFRAVMSDMLPPAPPTVAPVFDPGAFSVHSTWVDVFVTAPATDEPLGGGAPYRNVAYLEVNDGAGYRPLCQGFLDAAGTAWDPCNTGCDDPRLRCLEDMDGTRTFAGFRASRLTEGFANALGVRAVDLAGNVGDGTGLVVPVVGHQFLTQAQGMQYKPQLFGTRLVYVDDGARVAVELGENAKLDATDPACEVAPGQPATPGPSGVLFALPDGAGGQVIKLRAPGGDGLVCTVDDVETTIANAGFNQSVQSLSLSRRRTPEGSAEPWIETAAWISCVNGTDTCRPYVRDFQVQADHTLTFPDWQVALTTSSSSYADIQLAGAHALWRNRDLFAYGNGENATWYLATVDPATGLFPENPQCTFRRSAFITDDEGLYAARLSSDGEQLFSVRWDRWVEPDEWVFELRSPGEDGIYCSPTPEDDEVIVSQPFEQMLAPLPYWNVPDHWDLAFDGVHAVAIDRQYGIPSYLSHINSWDAGPDGRFGTDDDALRQLLPMMRWRTGPSLSGSLLAYAYEEDGSADVLMMDLASVRWEAVVEGLALEPKLTGDGALLYRTSEDYYLGLSARTDEGHETTRQFGASSMKYAVTGRDLVRLEGAGATAYRARATLTDDPRFFTPEDPAGMPLALGFTDNCYAWQPPAAGGGRMIIFPSFTKPNSSACANQYFVPYLLEPAGSDALGETLSQAAVVSLVSGRSDPCAATPDDDGVGIASGGVSASLAAWSASGTLCVRRPGPDGKLASGVTQLEAAHTGLGSVRVAGNRVVYRQSAGSDLRILEATATGVREVPAGLLVGRRAQDFAAAGDLVAFVADTASGPQIFLYDLVKGSLVQQTSHFSMKSAVDVDASGRIVWEDDLFGFSAIFIRVP